MRTLIFPLLLACLTPTWAETLDVIVVGGGLAGLSAAKDVVKAGKSVVVLEARNRTGGRVRNAPLKNGGETEVGAEFVGPTQDRVLALAEYLGLETFKTYNTGSNVLNYNGQRTEYEGAIPPVDIEGLLQVLAVQTALNNLASEIDVTKPWAHPNATELDGQTFKSFVDSMASLPSARFLLELASIAIFATQTSELSLLYTAAYVAAGGNSTAPGSLDRLINTADGAQESRIVGGTGLLPTRLAENLGPKRVKLNHPVESIKKVEDYYKVTTRKGRSFEARKVIVAMSPPLAGRIRYSPLLPAARDQLTQRMPMAAIGKAIAIYKTPFWRADNLTGQATSDSGTTRVTFDSSPPDGSFGVMLGFILADQMRELDGEDEVTIQDLAKKDFVNYFGPKAADVESWVIQRWDRSQFSRGGPVAYGPPGVLTKYGPNALRKPVDGIYWAGTEASPDYWIGYMDGAIRSGEEAAKNVLASL